MLPTSLRNSFSFLKNTLALLTLIILTGIGTMPAHAVSCEDVRGLSKAEQDYWSKRLNLTAEQRHQIWLACYRDYRPNQPKSEELVLR